MVAESQITCKMTSKYPMKYYIQCASKAVLSEL